jgi:hypothetical protein
MAEIICSWLVEIVVLLLNVCVGNLSHTSHNPFMSTAAFSFHTLQPLRMELPWQKSHYVLAPLMCALPTCAECCSAGIVTRACSRCWAPLCESCGIKHCERCGAAAEYCDSPRAPSEATATTTAPFSDAASTAASSTFEALDKMRSGSGVCPLDEEHHGRLHHLPLMSRCHVWDHDLNGWRWFGRGLQIFRDIADDLQWERTHGLVIFNLSERACLHFNPHPEAIEPAEALAHLRRHVKTSLGLVLGANDDGSFDVAHIEVTPTGCRRTQTRQRAALDRILRGLISRHDVAFWQRGIDGA